MTNDELGRSYFDSISKVRPYSLFIFLIRMTNFILSIQCGSQIGLWDNFRNAALHLFVIHHSKFVI